MYVPIHLTEMPHDAHVAKLSSKVSMSMSKTQRSKSRQFDKSTIELVSHDSPNPYALIPILDQLKEVDAFVDGVDKLVLLVLGPFGRAIASDIVKVEDSMSVPEV